MSRLFDINEINKSANQGCKLEACAMESITGDALFIRSKTSDLLNKLIGKIRPGQMIEFCTAGEFSMHELLQYLLSITGPANVYLSTWTIKETPARVIYSLINQGYIKGIYCVLDYRIRTLDAKHFDLIKSILTEHKLTKCHAKTIAIEGERMSLSVISSANFSNNQRIETGCIKCSD